MKKYYFLLVILAIAAFVFYFGRFLVVDEKPRVADAIIVLSGDDGRLERAVALRNEGYAEYLIVSRADGRGGIPFDSVLLAGVPSSFIIPEYFATNTYTNAGYTKKIMIEHGFKSALVVSSTYHMRRTKYIFDQMYKGAGIELIFIASPSRHFDPLHWWRSKDYIHYAFTEYVKLAGYLLNYGKIDDAFSDDSRRTLASKRK